jgi:hypothetical protein
LLFRSLRQIVGNDCRQRRGSVGSLDSGMSISFQSTSTNNAVNCKQNAENAAPIYVTSAQVALAVSTTMVARPIAGMMQVPALLPNSALYQYNNDQMMNIHEIYDEHQRMHPEKTGRSTDV